MAGANARTFGARLAADQEARAELSGLVSSPKGRCMGRRWRWGGGHAYPRFISQQKIFKKSTF